MTTNCHICKASLEINETGKVVFCPECDRTPDRRKESLGGLLDAIKTNETNFFDKVDKILSDRIEEIDDVTIQYKCLTCQRPINGLGWCVECEDELRETL